MRVKPMYPSDSEFAAARENAIRWARSALMSGPTYILDTETTGLVEPEIVQIGVINLRGDTVLDTLIKPDNPDKLMQKSSRGMSAFDIHGIAPDMLEGKPSLADIIHRLAILHSATLIIYNADYDYPLLKPHIEGKIEPRQVLCAMKRYAEFVGQWNDHFNSFKYQKLPPIEGETAHNALSDCRATLALINRMASSEL